MAELDVPVGGRRLDERQALVEHGHDPPIRSQLEQVLHGGRLGRLLTYVTWGLTALVGMGARLGTYALTDLPDSGRSLYLSVGLTLAGESLVLAARGFLSGERFAAQGRDSQATQQVIRDQKRARLRHVPPRG